MLMSIILVVTKTKSKRLEVVPSDERALRLAAFASDETIQDAYTIVYDVHESEVQGILNNYRDNLNNAGK